MLTTAALKLIADVVLGAIQTEATDAVRKKLAGDPARIAFSEALAKAVQNYARQGTRLALAAPLLKAESPLSQPAVAAELAKIVQFGEAPDAAFIGQRWRMAVEQPPAWRDFTTEADLLLRHLRAELANSEAFRPVFAAKSLEAIATQTAVSAEALDTLTRQLDSLTGLLATGFGQLTNAFAAAQTSIRQGIRDYTLLIDEKTRDFVGRQFLLGTIDNFLAANPRGYYIIRGDPGIGKTAIAAQYVKAHGVPHHFNVRAEGITTPDAFLGNICSQLIAAFDLPYPALPPKATQDSGFLSTLLGQAAARLEVGERLVIIVDALDESDSLGLPAGTNPLFLPRLLPHGVYIVMTMRKESLGLFVECEKQELTIDPAAAYNRDDVDAYVRLQASRPGIQRYLKEQGHNLTAEQFVRFLVDKSQGNFMYLRYVLPEIASGAYSHLHLEKLPAGLEDYYEDHWQRMKAQDSDAWFDYKLPIMMALTVVEEPVSKDLIADYSGVSDRRRLTAVLQEWSPFLHREEVSYEGRLQTRYRIYHTSFLEFIARKEEIAEERVSRMEARRRIAGSRLTDLYGGE